MGMFDTVYIQKSIPFPREVKKAFKDKDWSLEDFQTKDLGECMSSYYIKKNGFLYEEVVHGEYVDIPEEERKARAKKHRWFSNIQFNETGRELVKKTNTATVEVYSYVLDDAGNRWDIELEIILGIGKVQSLKVKKAVISQTAEEIKKSDDEWQARLDAIHNHPWNKTKRVLNKVTFRGWDFFWRSTARVTRKVGSKIDSFGFWIYKNM